MASQVERHRTGLAGERDRLEALRLEQVRLAAERTDLIRSAGELRERESQLARRAERLATELAEAETEATRLVRERTRLADARDRTAADLATLAARREHLGGLLAELERELGEGETQLAEARLTLAARQSSREALQSLEVAREGYASGVRAIFAEAGEPVAGIIGTIADLLDVPQELERAVEAVLGERLEWVVVERFEHARAAVEYLQLHSAGAATFLPLDRLATPEPPDGAADPDEESLGLADQVRAPLPGLAHYLFHDVRLVEHLDEAEALWRQNGIVATYVTPAGEVLSPTGRLRGGAGEGLDEPSLLARKRQLRELEEEVARVAASAAAAQEDVARVSGQVTGLRENLAHCDQQLAARQADRLSGEKDLEQTVREHERVQRHLETVRLESGQVALQATETTATLARLEQRIAAAHQAETGHETTIGGLRETIESAQQRETELVGGLTSCRVEVASVAERVEALGRELGRIDQMEAELTERLAQAQVRQGQLAERQVWLAEERGRTDTSAREVAVERDREEADARVAAEHHEALLTEQRQLEQEIRGVDADLGRLIGAIHDIELASTERRVRREELAQDVFRTFGVEEAALAAQHDPQRDLAGLQARVGELDERLTAIGPVNLVADEEYRELDERLTFLRTQHDDLTASIRDLEKALRGMTRTAQERFLQAFEQINLDFGKIFERLFEGGRAELRMVEAEEGGDPLDTGVDLMAQPRGKRLQSVTLLSGGERALTGLALLFAIFYFRPSPFCVLDEVDAPLDDANIHRFLRVLRELTSRTQFLVITHNRRTMEAADLLYGVTMEEPGLSKLVSVKLNA
jgi:chromosome segregation protein